MPELDTVYNGRGHDGSIALDVSKPSTIAITLHLYFSYASFYAS